jgi:TonB family protein
MQITARHNLYRLGIAAAVAALTSVACNNSDYKTGDNTNTPAATNVDTGLSKTTDTANNTPVAHTAVVHSRKKATTSIVMTEAAAGTTAPQFPGGQKALDSYVNDHINYPQNAIDNDVTGTVRVSFVVDEEGRISKAKLMNPRKVGEGLDEEALRVVSNMPDWKPATKHGKKIKTRLELPISFQVES